MRARTVLGASLVAGLTIAARCAMRSEGSGASARDLPATPVAAAVTAAAPTPDVFSGTVRPILSARCGKCHDPGGKMYERLPFDDPQVVSSRSAGVLRRLKGDDRATVEKWLAGLAPAPAGQ